MGGDSPGSPGRRSPRGISLVEGVPRNPFLALQVWLLYAGILASGVVVDYVLPGRYLGLIRHKQNEVLIPPR